MIQFSLLSIKGIKKIKLQKYAESASLCVGTLLMDRQDAEVHLQEAVGMKMGHVHKFMDKIWKEGFDHALSAVAVSLGSSDKKMRRI